MTTHHARVTIDAPTEEVWATLADFGGIWRYNPSVNTSQSLTAANGGPGAERRCDLSLAGASVDERIVEWDEGQSYAVAIVGGKKMPPIRNPLARLRVEQQEGTTVASGSLTYEPKFGPLGRVLDRLVISRQFGRAFAGIFAGLKYHVETGNLVERDNTLDYAVVDTTGPTRATARSADTAPRA